MRSTVNSRWYFRKWWFISIKRFVYFNYL